jgi:hypothetical protein
MRSGSRIVLLFAAFAALAAGLFQAYSRRALDTREVATPVTAARAFVTGDNTVVGLLGGVRYLDPERVEAAGPSMRALVASVVGARDSGRLYADVEFDDQQWAVQRAVFVMSDGTRLPLTGDARPTLEPAAEGP